MAGGHHLTHGLHHAGDSAAHRLAPEAKILATVLFIGCVVATPREAVGAFAAYLLIAVVVARGAALPAGLIARRLPIEVPFLAFALFLPVVGSDPRVEVGGLWLSEPGLWAAWNIVAKGTLGVLAAIVLGATTPVTELLDGLRRLRVPRAFVAIAGFMVRYLDIIVGDAERMSIARRSRGYDGRWLWQARAVASSAGTLFVRSYERGERVHVAMQARGYTGSMPPMRHHRASRSWRLALLPPAGAAVVLLGALVLGA